MSKRLQSLAVFVLLIVGSISISDAQSARFQLNNDGTITDTKTSLMWEQAPSSGRMTWSQAAGYAKNLRLTGYKDWRLPSINELKVLLNISKGDGDTENESNRHTYLMEHGFKNIQINEYWSSSAVDGGPQNAWDVRMDNGTVGYNAHKNSMEYVLCVRTIKKK